MFLYLVLLFVVLPVVEITILIRIGQATEWWVPFAMMIVTGVVGTALARRQGLKVYDRIREEMQNGRVPADAVIDGFLVLTAGILFALPGVLSDVAGIALLIPTVRRWVKRGLRAWFRNRIQMRMGPLADSHWQNADRAAESQHDRIIDAKVLSTRVEDVKKSRS